MVEQKIVKEQRGWIIVNDKNKWLDYIADDVGVDSDESVEESIKNLRVGDPGATFVAYRFVKEIEFLPEE